MDNKEVIRLEDGRHAERLVREDVNDSGEAVTVTELFVEPKIEKKLAKRVVEYTRPVIHRREIETVDEATGAVVDKKVESIDPSVKMELREHVVSVPKAEEVSSQSYVTREELKDLILALKTPVTATAPDVSVKKEAEDFFAETPKKVRMQEVVQERVEASHNLLSPASILLMVFIVAEIGVGAWMLLYWN